MAAVVGGVMAVVGTAGLLFREGVNRKSPVILYAVPSSAPVVENTDRKL